MELRKFDISLHLHFQQHPELVTKHTGGWESSCVRAILDVGLGCWMWRNEMVHGKTAKEAAKAARVALEAQVERVYADTCYS